MLIPWALHAAAGRSPVPRIFLRAVYRPFFCAHLVFGQRFEVLNLATENWRIIAARCSQICGWLVSGLSPSRA